ncbi:uncharacterized protein Dvar_37040 [Desulfosarcina variabilis str. Montpellier]
MTKKFPNAIKKEMQLLLLAARRPLDRQTCEAIRAIASEPINWTRLVNMAIAHKTPYLLFQSLKKAFPDAMPAHPALKDLEKRYFLHLRYSLRTTTYLLTILNQLAEKGILAVPFKGPTLSALAYGEPTLRPIGDLDVLVARSDAVETVDFLKAGGYQPEVELNAVQFNAYVSKKNGLALYNPIQQLSIDLHWEMSANYSFVPLTVEQFKDELIGLDLGGQTVSQPRMETILVYQCLHGMREGWPYVESLATIAGLISRHQLSMDWAEVTRIAQQWRCQRIMHLAFSLAGDLFDVPLPINVSKMLYDDPVARQLADEIKKDLLGSVHPGKINSMPFKFSSLHFRVRERWSEKIRYVRNVLFGTTAEDWRKFTLAGKLSFLHVILRPLRLGMKYFWGMGR